YPGAAKSCALRVLPLVRNHAAPSTTTVHDHHLRNRSCCLEMHKHIEYKSIFLLLRLFNFLPLKKPPIYTYRGGCLSIIDKTSIRSLNLLRSEEHTSEL